MLILTRRNGEAVKVEGVTFTILESKNGRVKVGVTAPGEMKITRPEKPAVIVKQ